jgi:glycerol uptake facilitator-like aquaporin
VSRGAIDARALLAVFVGTAFLLLAVVGSGIMAQRLSPNDTGLQLLENALATGLALTALIFALGPVSGAHLNPVVTLAAWSLGGIGIWSACTYVLAQVTGAVVGVVVANVSFSLPAVEVSEQVRSSGGIWASEAVATFGLVLVIFGVVRSGRAEAAPFAVGGYIGAAILFASSTSFANPAATVARVFTDTFAGISPRSVLPFVLAEVVGTALAVAPVKVLYPEAKATASRVVVPHQEAGGGD